MNVLYLNPDQMRADMLGCYGHPLVQTPNIDRLAAAGLRHHNCYVQHTVCSPSRCSFMTGWYPHVHGHRSMKNMLKAHHPNLLSVLRTHGYHVWWGGKNDLVSVETPADYLAYCDTKHAPATCPADYHLPTLSPDDPRKGVYYQGVMTRDGGGPLFHDRDQAHVLGAVDFIANRDDEQPFCVFLPLGWPHPPYKVEEDFYDLIDPDRLPPRHPVPEGDLPALDALRKAYGSGRLDAAAWVEVKRVYYGMCAKIDHLFGLVVEALKQAGLYDDTLIVFLSDHGDFAGDYELPEKTHMSLQDSLLRVPFIIKPPASLEARPGVRTQLAELVDLTATIYELLEVDPGYDSYGRSLVKSLRGDEGELREAVFAEVGARRTDRAFKNLDVKKMAPDSFYGVQSQAALPAHDAGSYAICCRTQDVKYVRRGYIDHHELYDLKADPGEIHNLSGDPAYADIEWRMERLLLDHFMTTADVLPHEQDSRSV